MLETRLNTDFFEAIFIQYFSDAVDALRKAYFNLQNLKLDSTVAEGNVALLYEETGLNLRELSNKEKCILM